METAPDEAQDETRTPLVAMTEAGVQGPFKAASSLSASLGSEECIGFSGELTSAGLAHLRDGDGGNLSPEHANAPV